MAIVVQYGPIADGLSLASQAGVGQGFNIQANRDLQALQLQNSMQGEIDRNNANLMQNSLAYSQLQSQQQDRQQSLAQQNAYRQAQMQMEQQNATFNQQHVTNQEGLQSDQLDEKTREFNAEQQTRADQAKSLAALRQGQIDKMNNPPPKDQSANVIRANGDSLRSLDQQAASTQKQIQQLTAALSKAKDPYTGDAQQAAGIQDQINGLKFSLDGIDPATGKKAKAGVNDQRDQLRKLLQNFGNKLHPDASLSPSDVDPTQMDFHNDPANEGLDDPADPLYQVNLRSSGGNGIMNNGAGADPQGQQQTGTKGPATPAMIMQMGQQIAQQMGAQNVADPRVRQAVRQLLTQQGFSIPTIQ